MTADDLMRLVNRYVEACDDLGAGLFEKPLTATDDLHAKATGLHKQILDEVYRLHADVAQARQTAEYWKAEHLAGNARIGELHDEAERAREHLRLAIDHIAALNGALEDLASLGATVAICGTKYDDAAARKVMSPSVADQAAFDRIKTDIKARAAALHEGCQMPMDEAMELAQSEALGPNDRAHRRDGSAADGTSGAATC